MSRKVKKKEEKQGRRRAVRAVSEMGAGPINVNQTALTGPNEGFIRRGIHDFSSCSQCHISTPELD